MRLEIALVAAVREGRVLLARRDDDAHQGGRWEFPGGKVEAGETAAVAARREMREETGLEVDAVARIACVEHDYPDRRVRLHLFIAYDWDGELAVDDGRPARWADADELRALPIPAANDALVQALLPRLLVDEHRD